jgi:hypothetical protein
MQTLLVEQLGTAAAAGLALVDGTRYQVQVSKEKKKDDDVAPQFQLDTCTCCTGPTLGVLTMKPAIRHTTYDVLYDNIFCT